jgi:hypothetical protein
MSSHRQWTERELAWIGAFDSIPLLAIVETMRSLDLFKERTLSHHLKYDPQQQAAETLRAASATVQAKEGVQETEAEGRWSDRCGDTIEAMKKAAGVARCGLSGKIDCQCNNNTPSPDNVEAAARFSSGGVLISVPRGGTSCMFQGGDSSSNSLPRKVRLSGSLAIVWSPHQRFAAR